MYLEFQNKKSKEEILSSKHKGNLSIDSFNLTNHNYLIKGDNLCVLNKLIKDYDLKGKVDLIYIDPPFATKNIFRISDTRTSTISGSLDDEIAYSDTLSGYKYLEFIRERLILLHELLSDKGSIYLHIDYKIGYYIKIIMDEVFGIKNFRNDITRIKCNPKNFKRKAYGNIKDMILFYSKTNNPIWNEPSTKYTPEDEQKLFSKINEEGRRYTTIPLHAPGELKVFKPFKGVMPPKGRHWRSSIEVLEDLDNKGLIEWSKNGNPRKIIFMDE